MPSSGAELQGLSIGAALTGLGERIMIRLNFRSRRVISEVSGMVWHKIQEQYGVAHGWIDSFQRGSDRVGLKDTGGPFVENLEG